MPKLSEKQFYCVSCRKRVSLHQDEICFLKLKNKKVKGGVPALNGQCNKCDTSLYKFVKRTKSETLKNKYGKC
jgi:hypothetical protein